MCPIDVPPLPLTSEGADSRPAHRRPRADRVRQPGTDRVPREPLHGYAGSPC
ncbi:hypothetical protein ACFFX0_05070 [Citricoccus parietis]|uniref:Uncharacterized protein n=1 Tax=Citricoccus parietis TaxID=592307 RepID=A0ABV5FVW0_9MICC